MRALRASRALAGIAALSAATSCGRCGAGRTDLLPSHADQERDFGDVEAPAPSAAEAAAYLALARAILDPRVHDDATMPPSAPGRRVALALWRGGEASVASAGGATLADAVAKAARAIAGRVARVPDADASPRGRLELDVPTRLVGVALGEDLDVPLASVGLEGVFVAGDDGKAGIVLPGEVTQRRGLFHDKKVDHVAVEQVLASRAGVAESAIEGMRAYGFRAAVFVEPAAGAEAPTTALPVVRAMVDPPVEITVEGLLDGVRRGADYLARVTSPAGRYIYEYRPSDDHDETSYGFLRHAGTTYALFEAYGELRMPEHLRAGELALGYLQRHLAPDESSHGVYLADGNEEEEQKVGGSGLALLAWTEHARVTGGPPSPRDLETMDALGRFILAKQYEDGHFRDNADVERETGKKGKRELWYYTGEAILGLMRLYEVDPRRAFLEGARRGADWVLHVRDARVSADNLEHDHWMSYALDALYRVTRERAYLDHAIAIARAIAKAQHGPGAAAPDYVGAFYDGETTPTATRLEAYDSDIRLLRAAGEPDGWLLGPARQAARAMLRQQFRPENDYWIRNPAKAVGGVRESPLVSNVRIDYVQHAICAWLHLARALRDPAYGTHDAR